MSVGRFVSDAWHRFQREPLPALADGVGPLGRTHRRSVAVLDLAEVERHLHHDHRGVGHPPSDRNALARALLAKAVWDLPTTSAPGGRLRYDPTLRRPVGWCRVSGVPSGSTFSRAFAWFAETRLPGRMHGAPVSAAYGGPVVGHVSRDSTATGGRERPAPRPAPERGPKRRRGRPRKGGRPAGQGADAAGAAAGGAACPRGRWWRSFRGPATSA